MRTMTTRPTDTPPEVEEILIEGYQRMSGREKIERVLDLNRTAEAMAAARIRAEYGPDLPERELRLRLAALRIPRRLMIEAFGWDPEVEGW